MKRIEAIACISRLLDRSWLIVSCNGMISRELYTCGDAPSRFYMIGSMGLASSIGLGLALAQPSRTVVVFDGDGNVLMNMGVLGNVAASGAANLYHVVLDNSAHGSTGDQKTISDHVPLDRVAVAAGYRRGMRVASLPELSQAFQRLLADSGPAMLLATVERGNEPHIERVEIRPPDLTSRFRDALALR